MPDKQAYVVLTYAPKDGISCMLIFDDLEEAEANYCDRIGDPEDFRIRRRVVLLGPVPMGSNVMDAPVLRNGDARASSNQ